MRVRNQQELFEALQAGTTLLELEGDLAKLVSAAKASRFEGLPAALGGVIGFLVVTSFVAPAIGIGLGGGIIGGVVGAAVAAAARKLIAEGKNGPELVKMLEEYEAVPQSDGKVLLQKHEA
jgi:hypothetical protein